MGDILSFIRPKSNPLKPCNQLILLISWEGFKLIPFGNNTVGLLTTLYDFKHLFFHAGETLKVLLDFGRHSIIKRLVLENLFGLYDGYGELKG